DGFERTLDQWKLREQILRDAGLGLVARPQAVAEAANHVVGGRAEVRDVRLAKERQGGFHDSMDRVHFTSIGRTNGVDRVVGAKELVGGIQNMALHGISGML